SAGHSQLQRIMPENANASFAGIPRRDDINEPLRDPAGVKDTSIEQDGIRTSGLRMRSEKCGHVTSDSRILCVRQAKFLQRYARAPARRFVGTAMWKEAIENDLLDFLRCQGGGQRTTDQAAAFADD